MSTTFNSSIAKAISITSWILFLIALLVGFIVLTSAFRAEYGAGNLLASGIAIIIGSFLELLLMQATAIITEACYRYIQRH